LLLKEENNKWCQTGFGFGILSAISYNFFIIPLIGIIISLIGLRKIDEQKEKGLWMGVVGLIFSVLYMFMFILQIYGYI